MSFATPPARQLFSVPYNFVLYTTENPATPEVLEKLHQTCKFFFAKNPILIARDLTLRQKDFFYDWYHEPVNEIKLKAKFWPTSYFSIECKMDTSKIYRFSPIWFASQAVNLSLPEFDLLVKENTIRTFVFVDGMVENATVDQILQKLPNANIFCYQNSEEIYSSQVFEKLIKLERTPKLIDIDIKISKLTDSTFPTSLLLKFMQKHCCSKSYIKIWFGESLIDRQMEFGAAMEEYEKNNPEILETEECRSRVEIKIL